MHIGSLLSTWKLLLIAASFSRPHLRGLCLLLLRPFVRKDGTIQVQYRCAAQYLKVCLRKADLESDFQSFIELGAYDSYHVDHEFCPDILIDGGANIGLFTLRTVAEQSARGNTSMRSVLFEPMESNVVQIQRHLNANQIKAEIMQGCIGGTRKSLHFYCRGAIDSSFDPEKPYQSVIEVPVYRLQDAIGDVPVERILLKLDIEGMEVEVLQNIVPGEQRAIYVVGEVHEFSVNAPLLQSLFEGNGWVCEFFGRGDDQSLFHACSPASLPLLPSMQNIKSPVQSMA